MIKQDANTLQPIQITVRCPFVNTGTIFRSTLQVKNQTIYCCGVAFPPPLLLFSPPLPPLPRRGELSDYSHIQHLESSASSGSFCVHATKPCSVCDSRHHITTNNPSSSASFCLGAPEALCQCFTFHESLLQRFYDTKKSQISTYMKLATTVYHILLCKKEK